MQSSKKEIYFLSSNRLFSSSFEKIFVHNKFDLKFLDDFLLKDFSFENIEKLILAIEKLKLNGREFNFNLPIEKFEEFNKKVLSDKCVFNEVLEDNFKFQEASSSLFVYKEVLEKIKKVNEVDLKNLNEFYLSFKDKFGEGEKQIISKLKSDIKELERKVEESKKKYDLEFNNDLESLNIQKDKKVLEVSKLSGVKEDLILSQNLSFFVNLKFKYYSFRIKRIENKLSHLNRNISFFSSQNNLILEEMKLGKSKCVPIILGILSLGLIYWTDWSLCKNKVVRNKLKITNSKERVLILNNKFEVLNENFKLFKKKSNIIDEKVLEDKRNKVSKQITTLEDEISKLNSKITKLSKNSKELVLGFESDENTLNDLKEKLDFVERNSIKELKLKIKEIETIVKNYKRVIVNRQKEILSQRIDFEGDRIVKLK